MGIGAGVFGASRMGRNLLGMGKNAGIGAWKGVRRQDGGFNQSLGVSGKLGNLTGQGVNIGAKRLRQGCDRCGEKEIWRLTDLLFKSVNSEYSAVNIHSSI